jgi:hypothetical protein
VFPPELEQNAFRVDNGEFGWTREQIPLVVEVLRSQGFGILGGELWWVHGGVYGSISQRQGPPGVYTWVTNRRSGETWEHFAQRGASDAAAAVERWPEQSDLPPDLPGRILYNLTWVSEAEFNNLSTQAV